MLKNQKFCDQQTFCSMRYLTERKEPKNIGKSAIKTKLEYATSIPSVVAAALPVAFLAVSFTAAVRFATVSFTTDSAILTLSLFFCSRKRRQSQSSLLAWPRGCFHFQWSKYTLLSERTIFTCFILRHYRFDKKYCRSGSFLFQVAFSIWHFQVLIFRFTVFCG